MVARQLRIHKSNASRRVGAAIEGGWVVNLEKRRGYPADLVLGEPLPLGSGLPDPERFARKDPVPVKGATAQLLADGRPGD